MTDCLSSVPKASGSSLCALPSLLYGKQPEQQLGDGNLQVNQLLVRSRRVALYHTICKLIFIYHANFPIGNSLAIDCCLVSFFTFKNKIKAASCNKKWCWTFKFKMHQTGMCCTVCVLLTLSGKSKPLLSDFPHFSVELGVEINKGLSLFPQPWYWPAAGPEGHPIRGRWCETEAYSVSQVAWLKQVSCVYSRDWPFCWGSAPFVCLFSLLLSLRGQVLLPVAESRSLSGCVHQVNVSIHTITSAQQPPNSHTHAHL